MTTNNFQTPSTPLSQITDQYQLFLGSQSPRRRELLSLLGLPFSLLSVGELDESIPSDLPQEQVPEYLSRHKARQILAKGDFPPNGLLITADTVVLLGNQILGKPADAEQAEEMLHQLSGRSHQVITGVCLSTPKRHSSFSALTTVQFAPLTQEQITYYVEQFQPLDKAGAYGIQEWIGAVAISAIEGSFYNVMGLPLHALWQALLRFA